MKRRCDLPGSAGTHAGAALATALLAVLLTACSQNAASLEARQPVPLPASAASAQTNALWIDVRTAGEYAQGHLPGAILIPYDQIDVQIASVTTDLDAPIHLYCRSGRRSGLALQTLQKMGYRNVVNAGAYSDLVRNAKP